MATASTGQLFKQQALDRLAWIGEVNLPSGFWQATGEVGSVPTANVRVANKYTISAVDYTNSIELSKDFFDRATASVVA
jgi:hypothetical protein